ncbi:hypothetical protein BDZ91DRAFT_825315 [Kalaharituber pfeilii]|nr:hypothetical protein BDZ91DRAFT_825315 [Kalaharituber pfeilii]
MLGRLLSSASSTTTSPAGTRPSTAVGFEGEDLYTRTLLYPDTSLLSNNHSLSGSGYISTSVSSLDGEHIDIDGSRDVRVVIAQDGTGSDGKVVIYDSKPGAGISTQACSPPNYGNHFAAYDDGAPLSPGLCGGFNRRRRSPTSLNSSYSGGSSTIPKDEWRIMTECMFGAVSLAYKGPSTKLHILPNLAQDDKSGSTTPSLDPRSRSRGVGLSHNHPHPFAHHMSMNSKDRKSVLVTRLFAVPLPAVPSTRYLTAPGAQDRTPTPASSLGSTSGFPFPAMSVQNSQPAKPMKPAKTPMYGIGLIISLPQSSSANTIKRCPNCWAIQYDFDTRRPNTGLFCCDVAAACMDDEYRTDTVMVESSNDSGIADDQMEFITKHWDIITRALTELQGFAQSKIVNSLLATGIVSPTFPQPSYKYRNRVELPPGALMYDDTLKLEVERFKWRVVSGIKIPRVVTGQGRWGAWRDEARWLNKRFGGKEQNFLFLTLITAFLGHHTEWLDVLGPVQYRNKHQQRKQITRTVIISHDKIIARRIIYLLSAFLPARSVPAWPAESSILTSRNSSTNILSQSPTMMSYMSQSQLSRGSTRRRPRKRPSKLSMMHGDTGEEGGWDIPVNNGTVEATLLRQQSDSSLQLPLFSLGSSKKAHANPVATTATKCGDAHHKESRPGSSGSSASFSLMHTLRRSGTGNASADSTSTGTSGWSFLSSIWSIPRSSSTGYTSEASTFPDEPIDCVAPTRSLHNNVCPEKYDDEVVVQDHDLYPGYDDQVLSPPKYEPMHFTRPFQNDAMLNYTIAEDGVIDIELASGPALNAPIFGHSTAYSASPIGSPASTGHNLSMLSLDRSSLSFSSLLSLSEDTTDNMMNVAGWMEDERFHPDFSLQAVKPYADLETDIKRSMSAEPTPSQPTVTSEKDSNGWIEVCSVLLIDTRTYTIKRLKLKRRKKLSSFMTDGTCATVTPNTPLTAKFEPAIHTQQQQHMPPPPCTVPEEGEIEELFEEEWVMDMDDTLATAVERTIGVDSDFSSRAPNNKGGKPPRSALGKEPVPPSTPDSTTNHKVLASDCKGLILGALEEVVKRCTTGRSSAGFVENVLTEGVVRWLNDVEDIAPSVVF